MTQFTVSSDVPKEIIDAEIRAAVVKALGTDPDKLVRAVVDAAMDQKKDRYDKDTIFQTAVADMIRGAAKEEFKAWLEQKRPLIMAAVRERLTREEGFVGQVADKLVTAMAASFYVSVHLDVK